MPRAPRLSKNEMDDEFEKFLKESLSDADDSMDTARLQKFFNPSKKAEDKRKKKDSQPWWMKEDDVYEGVTSSKEEKVDDFQRQTPSANKWLKPKKQSTPVIAEDSDEEDDDEENRTTASTKVKLPDRDKQSTNKNTVFDTKVSISERKARPSISRDSLEGTFNTKGKQEGDYNDSGRDIARSGVHPVHGSFEETLSYTGPSEGTTLGSTGPGVETMEEMADKARFFKELEEKEGTGVDFSQLNKEVDMMGTIGSLSSPYMGTADEHSSPFALHKKESESMNMSDVESKSKDESSSKASPATVKASSKASPATVKESVKKPSMLSRVALLDTGGSTVNMSSSDVSSQKGSGDANIMMTASKGLTATTTDDMEALQAAFRNAANTPTLGLDESSYNVIHTDEPPVPKPLEIFEEKPRTVEEIIQEIEEERKKKILKTEEEDHKGEEERRRKEEELRIMEGKKFGVIDYIDGGLSLVHRGQTSDPFRSHMNESMVSKNQEPRRLDESSANTEEITGVNLQPVTERRGFDLQPAIEGRGFDLQPSNKGRGFDLQPSNKGRGFDLEPATEEREFDFQPANQYKDREVELQPFCADDEASHGTSSNSTSKRGKPKQAGKMKSRYGNIKSTGYGKPKNKSTGEAWSPADAAKHKIRGSEVPLTGKKGETGSNRNLVKSVESFATYIQEHFADARKLTPPPEVRYSREEPIISASTRDSKIQLLSRERALVSEVTEWQNQWKEAHRLNAKLKAELANQQREFERKEEELRLLHEKELFRVKQDNFVLQAKLNTEDEQRRVKTKTVFGKALEGASEEEIKLMQKEIVEQETLLQGYQQENERLYKEVKKMQISNRENEEMLFKENQKLHVEVATLRELSEQKDTALRHKGIITGVKAQQEIAAGNTAVLGAGRIAELQAECQEDKLKKIELKQQVRVIEQEKKELELHIQSLVRERKHIEEKIKNLRDVKQREFQDMQQQYKQEIEGLQKKLRWYAENQEMLDKDSQTLKEKDDELRRIRETLEKTNRVVGSRSQDVQRKAKERAADAKKIQDLERQVKEMNDIIRRRYPNSLPALIYAAASAPGEGREPPQSQPPLKSHTVTFLEEKVKQLEEQLSGKNDDIKRSLRVMEQKYNLMKYEDRVQNLEKQIEINYKSDSSASRQHTSIIALERELQRVKDKYKQKMQDVQMENDELRKKLTKGSAGGRETYVLRDGGRIEDVRLEAAELQEKLSTLAKELNARDHEIEMLKGVCDRLMQERFQTQTVAQTNKTSGVIGSQPSNKSKESSRRQTGSEDATESKQYEPQNFAGSHISDVLVENEHLKQQMETLSVEMERQRLRVQASLAEAESNIRKTKEAAAEEVTALKSRHVEEMEKVMAERALLHSDSQVARFTNQVASQKVLISHLQEQLSDARVEADTVAASHVREQVMKTQLDQLRAELEDAKKTHSPEMRHFEALLAKITAMEARHTQREQEIRHLVERAKHTATVEKDREIACCQQQLAKKNAEMQRFRAELDAILEILRELQRQGVILPMHSNTVQSLL